MSVALLHVNMDSKFNKVSKNDTNKQHKLRKLMEQARLAASSSSRRGWPLIHRSAFKNYFPRVKKLCQSNPDEIETRTSDSEGYTPLHVAALSGSVECFDVLLKAGADDMARSYEGETAIQIAAASGQAHLLLAVMNTNPFTSQRVVEEISENIRTKRMPLDRVTNSLNALESVITVLTKQEKYAKDQMGWIMVNTMEIVLERITQERALPTVDPACKVLEVMTPVLAKEILQSKILPTILSLIEMVNDQTATYQALRVVTQVIHHLPDTEEVMRVLGGPLAIFKIVQLHTSKELIVLVMNCITSCGRKSKISRTLAKPSAMRFFVDSVSEAEDTTVLASTTNALLSLVDGCFEARECLLHLGIVEKIVESLKPVNKSDIEPTIRLLGRLCTGDGRVEEILKKYPKAISSFMHFTEHSMSIELQQAAFELLWLIAGDSSIERRALASQLGPECLLSLTELGNNKTQIMAIQVLTPLTQPFHNMQNIVIEAGGVISLVKTIRNNERDDIRVLALQALENLSCRLANKPNYNAQDIFQSVDGVQLLRRLASKNSQCSEYALCSLSAYSVKNRTIRKALIDNYPNILQELLKQFQQHQKVPSQTYSRTLCNLAYGCLDMQSQINSLGGLMIKTFLNQMSVGTQYQRVDNAFQIAVLARIFTDSKQTDSTQFALQYLVQTLKESSATGDSELQMHTTARLSSLIKLRAGIADGLVSLKVVPIVVDMLAGKKEGPRRVAAVTLCLLTTSPHATREILRCYRLNPKLSTRMRQYCHDERPSPYFIESWRSFCKTNSVHTTRYAQLTSCLQNSMS